MNRSFLHRVLREAEELSAGSDIESDAGLLHRFAKARDEQAFTEILRRHGPMVWAVCRQLLLDHADAEDAFQATFLALVRSASSIRDGNAVGGWLHGVAVRAATRVRRCAARRKQREHRAATTEADRSVPEATWESLLAAVHEEVQRLPAPLRTVFILCELEGVRQPDAAARLGWKPGTLTGRLSRARQMLLDRLEGRGLAPLIAGGAGLGVVSATSAGAVPTGLMDTAMTLIRAGGAVPPAVLKLVGEVTPMALNRMKLAAAAVLVAGGLAAGLGAALFPPAQAQPPGSDQAPTAGSPVGKPSDRGEGTATTGSSDASFAPPAVAPRPGAGPGSPAGDGTSGTTSRPAAAYRYAAKPKSAIEFARLLNGFAAEGWEYVGESAYSPEELLQAARTPADLINNLKPGSTALLIFKRAPRSSARTSTHGDAGSGMPAPGVGAPGFPGGESGGGSYPGMNRVAPIPGTPDAGGPSRLRPGTSGSFPMPGGPLGVGGSDGAAASLELKTLTLAHAEPEAIARALQQLLPPGARVVAVPNSKKLIVSADPKTFEKIARLLIELDVEDESPIIPGPPGVLPPKEAIPNENLFEVIRLRTAKAEEAVELIMGIFGKDRVRVVADKSSNAIIVVKASQQDLKAIKALLEKTMDEPSLAPPDPYGRR